jgi:transposase-like protein
VEELLAERGIDVSYGTIRRWVLKFGPVIARPEATGQARRRQADAQAAETAATAA